jgi:hypothetical protein
MGTRIRRYVLGMNMRVNSDVVILTDSYSVEARKRHCDCPFKCHSRQGPARCPWFCFRRPPGFLRDRCHYEWPLFRTGCSRYVLEISTCKCYSHIGNTETEVWKCGRKAMQPLLTQQGAAELVPQQESEVIKLTYDLLHNPKVRRSSLIIKT